jgi:dihydroneopterin aldolase
LTWLLDPRLADCRRIFLQELAVETSIGFHDFERLAPQRVLVNVDIFVPIAASTSARDAVEDVVDYDFLRHRIIEIARSGHFNLQETLLDRIVSACFENPSIRAVRASTEKPHVYADCRTVGIEVFRIRP